jgi:hypothetical protein
MERSDNFRKRIPLRGEGDRDAADIQSRRGKRRNWKKQGGD